MAFKDIAQSIKWADDEGPVFAYFSAHFAKGTDNADKAEHDTVRYAIGYLEANAGKLAGDLKTVFANADTRTTSIGDDGGVSFDGVNEGMELRPTLSYRLEVHADGTIGVQPKINGKPIGGLPVETLPGSSVGAGLLCAASSTTAYTVSLDRQPKIDVPK